MHDLIGNVILKAWGAFCWVARIPKDYEQARRWNADRFRP